MQFHHHGYVTTDPRVLPAQGVGLDRPEHLPDEFDVLVVGTGPAGTITAAQLARFPHVHTRIIDSRPHRLEVGQADGIQARSMETFQAFGFAGRLTEEAYRITEMAFWKPDPDKPEQIVRTARPLDDPHGMSEFPHLLVNQARIVDYFNEFMASSPSRMHPDYGIEFLGLTNTGTGEYPIAVRLKHHTGTREGQERTVHVKYLVGGDGAHSRVRTEIGCAHLGQPANHAWGVMDVLAVTDFPDIRLKCAIQSSAGGNILHIPREGGHLFRMYVDLGEVTPERAATVRQTPIEAIIDKANAILQPYTLDVRHVAWWSVYEVGHRVTDKFDDVPTGSEHSRHPRVFIAGDACHTHSAKAGQGMNVSLQDGFNLGWKLGYVLSGRSPEALLATYSAERQVVAQNLIDFDRQWSAMMAKRPEDFERPSELEDFYVKTFEFPAGFMTQYTVSMITGPDTHQHLAAGFPIGKRFKSARVMRVCDGNPVHLGHLATADGRWRIYTFADAPGPHSALAAWAQWLGTSPRSPVLRYNTADDDEAVLDVKVIYAQAHPGVDISAVPQVFMPPVGPFGLTDYTKVFATGPDADIFAEREIDRAGAVVVVRPDQYVAAVLPLTEPEALAEFFDPILLNPAQGSPR